MEELIAVLIKHYGFELNGKTPEAIVKRWLEEYEVSWVRLAVIEALYLGRYKAFSVEQILNLWVRRGRTKFHFTHEFERLICRRLPKELREFVNEVEEETTLSVTEKRVIEIPSEIIPEIIPEEEEPEEEMSSNETEEDSPLPFSIDQFTPLFDRSNFYSKLKAVANKNMN